MPFPSAAEAHLERPPAARAPALGEARPRDFEARIRRRDMRSARQVLGRQTLLWQILGGIVAVGLIPAALVLTAWGDPQGIGAAVARKSRGEYGLIAPRAKALIRAALVRAELTPHVVATETDDTRAGLIAPDRAAQAWSLTLSGAPPTKDLPRLASPAAPPLHLAGTAIDRWRALQCLTTAIYYEAATEPTEGQRAVAQVVLNRVAHPAFPKTVCGVVYQGSERPGCQFSFACDGSLARAPQQSYWDRARRVAEDALAGYVYGPAGLATHYHTSAVHPGWSDSLTFLGSVGAHRFYRWSGTAGQPRAFNAVYYGDEPIAAPHPHNWTTTAADLADPLALEHAFEQGRLTALRQIQARPVPANDPQPALSAVPVATIPVVAAPPTAGRTVAASAFGQTPLARHDGVVAGPTDRRGTIAGTGAPAPAPAAGPGAIRPEYENAGKWIADPHN